MNGENGNEEDGLQVLAFKVGGEQYCVEVERVRSVIDFVETTRMPRAPKFVKGIINLRGQVIAVVDLAQRLGIPGSDVGPRPRIAVIESRDVAFGVIIDEPEVLRLSSKDVEPPPEMVLEEGDSNIIKGVAKEGDRLFIVLDADELLTAEEWKDLGGVTEAGGE